MEISKEELVEAILETLKEYGIEDNLEDIANGITDILQMPPEN